MDDQGGGQTGSGSDRRRFLWFSGLGALGAASAGGAAVVLDFVHPKVLFEPPTAFRVGRPEDFPANSITADYDRKVYIIRTRSEEHTSELQSPTKIVWCLL